MATAAEQAYLVAVQVAEGTRQASVASALATYQASGFAPASLAAFRTALFAAEIAYRTAVLSSATTNNVDPSPAEQQPFGGNNQFVGNTPGIQGGQ